MQLLSERCGGDEDAEKQEDMVATCDLADDVRDAIVEYQVSVHIPTHAPTGSLTQAPVLATESNVRPKL